MRRRCVAGIVAVVVGVAITACSDSGSSSAASSSAATSSSAAVCQAADELRSSLTALGEVQVVQEGTDALQGAFSSVQSDFAQLREDAGDQHADQIDRVQADVDQVRTTVDTAQGNPSAETLGAVASAVRVLVQDANTLVDQVGSAC